MKREVVIAVRNDQNQLLVLESASSLPVFPGGELRDAPQLKALSQSVKEATGLEIQGLHLSSTTKEPGREVHRYTAHVAGGSLLPFPTREGIRSASWVAPSLIPKLQGASKDMVELVAALSFTHIRDAKR